MSEAAGYRLERGREGGAPGRGVLALTGDWTALGLGRTADRLRKELSGKPPGRLDVSGLGRFDTAGAYAVCRATGLDADAVREARPDAARLMELVCKHEAAEPPKASRFGPAYDLLVRAGQGVFKVFGDVWGTFAFYGRLMVAIGRLLRHPSRIRVAPTVSLMERAGLDAVPIIVATNFFVGATIAFLGANLLSQFGASIFSVELVGIGVLREFAVLVTAIILAGRSASSFAAELGAMKMNQEVDAMGVMGVDPFEALVLPRFVAMLTMMPILTFAAVLAGLAGGIVVIWSVLNLSPAFFLQRMLENVGPSHFWIGMSKAPVLAVVIAAIGCRQGLEVGGDVEQLGRRVTSAVVQALFSIILIDAAFALLYMQLNL